MTAKKTKTLKTNTSKEEASNPNSSPVCYADSKGLRPEFQRDPQKSIKKNQKKT
jgi:hypothetical protein